MKTRFSAFDICSILFECREKLLGLRVLNIYDVDKKTYLLRFVRQDEKFVLLIESGIRIHITDFDWPKSMMPSGFTMKLRKHLRQKRLESIEMMGIDRIINMQFGIEESAFHIILELYDRGNIILTDYQGRIMSLLRPRALNEDTKFAVNELYPFHLIKIKQALPDAKESSEKIISYMGSMISKIDENRDGTKTNAANKEKNAAADKKGKGRAPTSELSFPLKKLMSSALSSLPYGPALIEHCLVTVGCDPNLRVQLGEDTDPISLLNSLIPREKLLRAIELAIELFVEAGTKVNEGFIFYKKAKTEQPEIDGDENSLMLYEEFEPLLYAQSLNNPNHITFPSFSKCVDEFFSKIESQKLDVKAENQEKTAIKKLENVRQDHMNRRLNLQKSQEDNTQLAELIELNRDLVDQAIKIIQSGLAAQMNWGDLKASVEEAKKCGDPIALCIKSLKLDTNRMIMVLNNPFDENGDANLKDDQSTSTTDASGGKKKGKKNDPKSDKSRGNEVEIDLNLSAYNNARAYYERKRLAFTKELKTLESSSKALKSAERKTKQLLKDFHTQVSINKSRKIYWFEKFYWFISSENYLVLAGRDQQQNELLVKKHLNVGDLYVHADIHGGSSVIIKNPSGNPVTPKTLNEAGVMAACYCSAWDAKITVSVWWVNHDQVSKTAPTGEYLTTGSFMIRGKKNILPPITLIMGFGIMFRLDDTSAEKHRRARKLKMREDLSTIDDTTANPSEQGDVELHMSNEESNSDSSDEEIASNQGQGGEDMEDKTSLFPDTEIGAATYPQSRGSVEIEDPEYSPILAPPVATRSKQKIQHKRKKNEKMLPIVHEQKASLIDKLAEPETLGPLKRGQKAKLKKIKDKYGDQDEEERRLKLELLAANAQTNQMTKATKKAMKNRHVVKSKAGDGVDNPDSKQTSLFDQFKPININVQKQSQNGLDERVERASSFEKLDDESSKMDYRPTKDEVLNADVVDLDDDEDEDISTHGNDDILLDTLTGRPCYQDEENMDSILYALTVCAPYSALQDFKYRVKVIPGFTKRGKAGKSALSYFFSVASKPLTKPNLQPVTLAKEIGKTEQAFGMKDDAHHKIPMTIDTILQSGSKNVSNPSLLERALIKAIKDNDLSRNLPARVKIYVPVASKK